MNAEETAKNYNNYLTHTISYKTGVQQQFPRPGEKDSNDGNDDDDELNDLLFLRGE
jgi:hypothetical protein